MFEAGRSIEDTLSAVDQADRLSLIAREWPGAERLVKKLAGEKGMRTDDVSSRFADGVAEALQLAGTKKHWLDANRVRRLLEKVDFKMDASYRALDVIKRSPELDRALKSAFGQSLVMHFSEKLDGRVGEWFASVQLFAREQAGHAASGTEQDQVRHRESRKEELIARVQRDFNEYAANVLDLIAQIDGKTMAMFEPLPADKAKALRTQVLADAELVQSYVDKLFDLMDATPLHLFS